MTTPIRRLTPAHVLALVEWQSWYRTTPREDRWLVFPPFTGLQVAFLQAHGRRLAGTATWEDESWLIRSGWKD